MKSKIKVALMGGTGYAAAELIRRLINHPNAELKRVSSIDHIGENVGQVHKNFRNKLPFILENISTEELVKDCDVVFLALPHNISHLKVPEIIASSNKNVKIIDFSGDYRIQDIAAYNKYYKTTHTNPNNIKDFVYGMPELNKEKIKGASKVANPGCFATAAALSMLPMAQAGLAKNKIKMVGPTGSSGSGVNPQEGTHHPTRSRNLKSYKVLDHQHQPEIEQTLSCAAKHNVYVDFIPISAPVSRGILVNSLVEIDPKITDKDIKKIYDDFYKDAPFVSHLGKGKFPETISILGTNHVEIGWALSEERNGTKTFASSTTIDNLVKGAAGQAMQNMNLMFGFEETAGLTDFGLWP